MKPLAWTLTIVALALMGGCIGAGTRTAGFRPAPMPQPPAIRAVWVARFHYRTPGDIREILQNCARTGFNTVLWQIRGDATVAYPSRIEPWSAAYGHADPGFDPLRVAVDEAHALGLRIEAWVNVMPGWFGSNPPTTRAHVHYAHPEWFLHDDRGRRQPLNEHYVILNPCLPAVRAHVASICAEIAERYDVDGVHLDYVRYAWDVTPNAARMYPRDASTVALFRRQTGLSPDDNATAWHHWRANQLTRLVEAIRQAVRKARPGATITAAVWGDERAGYRDYLQNGTGWLAAGLIDAAYPMAYREDGAAFAREVEAYRRLGAGGRVVPGIGIYKHERADQVRDQLRRCAQWGGDFALFSYESLFAAPRHASDARTEAQRAMRRAVLAETLGRS
jgi:uncharacterized lipoprotein YddW (UPF0748 family)